MADDIISSRNKNEMLGLNKIIKKKDQSQCNCVPKILLVDDVVFNLNIVDILIKTCFNLETIQVFNGLQAVNEFKEKYNKECQCENRSYKLILMDIEMPVMNGY